MNFSYLDGRIWFRNYQILWEGEGRTEIELNEIGPRFVLQPIRIFGGSFRGETIYQNPSYVSPNETRTKLKLMQGAKFDQRQDQVKTTKKRKRDATLPENQVEDLFKNINGKL